MIALTVYFDDPWWVGVVEIGDGGALRVARHVFGDEPSGPDVLHFILHRLTDLIEHAPSGVVAAPIERRISPKRAAREAARSTRHHGVSTKAQEALRLQIEARKPQRRVLSREQREQEAQLKRQKAHEKALARRRGR